jgi:hypothetical protein
MLIYGMYSGVVSANTILTSKTYVDNKVPAYNPSSSTQSVLTDTTTTGTIAKRPIFDGSVTYVAGTHAGNVPTMGAVMSAISGGTAALPWNTAEQNATGAYSTTFAASGTNVWPTADANYVVKGQTFANALATKQNKIAAHAANAADSVLTDSTTAGSVQKRAIYDGSTTYAAATDANKIPTAGFVETKQNKITTGLVGLDDGEQHMVPALVTTNSSGTALTGDTFGVLDYETMRDTEFTSLSIFELFHSSVADNLVPTVKAVGEELLYLGAYKQDTIAKSGYITKNGETQYNTNGADDSASWLNDNVKGTGLVTKTSTDGQIGERKIFEASSLSGYSALTGNNKLIADISIPTVGAMMSAISSGITAAAPTGTANTIANYDANGDLGTGIATANAPAYTSGSLTNGTNIATIAAVDTREAKMTCAGWPESVAVADRTDANCWLWNKN